MRRFLATFQVAVPRIRLRPAGSGFLRRTLTAAAVLAAVAVGVGFLDRDFRGPLLSIATPVTERFAALTGGDEESSSTRDRRATNLESVTDHRRLPLPAADANGVIQLQPSKTYVWSSPIRTNKRVIIRGNPTIPAVVILAKGGGSISAEDVAFENVRFLTGGEPTPDSAVSPLLTIHSDRLSLNRCMLHAPNRRSGIAWTAHARDNRRTGITVRDTVISGGTAAVRLQSVPAAMKCDNVLHLGPGELFRFATLPAAGTAVNVTLANVTQRNAAALVRVDLPLGNAPAGRMVVSAKDCVFHYAGANAALCVFGTAFPGQVPKGIVQFSGEGSLFPPGGLIAVEAAIGPASAARVDNDAVQIDGGLLAGPFEFAGPVGDDPATSVIAKHRAPVRSQHTPGIDARRLVSIQGN